MPRKESPAWGCIHAMCTNKKFNEAQLYAKAKMLLGCYRRVCWAATGFVDTPPDDDICYCDSNLGEALKYAIEKKKFDAAWSILRKFYLSAGMDPDAVEEMHKYDWDMFKAARIEALHTQELALPRDAEEDDDLDSQLMKKFGKQLTSEYDTFGSHSRYWWLDELATPCLAIGAKLLTPCEKEVLTLYIVDQLTMDEIATRLNISKNAVKKKLHKVFSYFPEMP